MVRSRILLLCVPMLLLAVACREEASIFDGDGTGPGYDEAEVRALIADLAVGEDMAANDEAEIEFWDTVDQLIDETTVIQPVLIEELAAAGSWAVRLGILHVLASVGTEGCVEPVLACLRDEHPVVARQAVFLLRELTDHQVTPERDVDDELPPMPDGDELEAWRRYHRRYGAVLHLRWTQWWEAHSDETAVD